MAQQNELQLIQGIVDRLDENRSAPFSYDQEAFDYNLIDGVELYDRKAHQNIPTAALTDYNPTVLSRGVRSQGASIPRMAWNHFIGRFSYNLNKTVQKFRELLRFEAAAWAHNAAEYDPWAHYAPTDMCFLVETVSGVLVYTFYRRVSTSPEYIQGLSPASSGHWQPMQGKLNTSSLLPFSAPGYRHQYSIADLRTLNTGLWYPVVTGLQDFNAEIQAPKEGSPQVHIEVYSNGMVSGYANPQRAELSVLSRFTGFPASSTDMVLHESMTDQIDGTVRDGGDSPIGFSKLPYGRQAVLWLRGGGMYALWNSFGSPFALHVSGYDNGLDDPVIPGARRREFALGALQARLLTPDAVRPGEAVNFQQVNGALPLPVELSAGGQLNAVRKPGSYTASSAAVANSLSQLPLANPGPFSLLVYGDRNGANTTVQQLTVRASGDVYLRVLSGAVEQIPWYRTASPDGINILVGGLYQFTINAAGHLILNYRTGDDPPNFWIAENGHLMTEIA
jgi:hypothetical protein